MQSLKNKNRGTSSGNFGLLPGVCVAALVTMSLHASAETWELSPRFAADLGYLDAVRLAEQTDSAIGLRGYGKLEFGRFSERLSASADLGFNFNQYETDDQGLNEDERPFAGFNIDYKSSERSRFKVRGSYVEDLISQNSNSDQDSEEVNEDSNTGLSAEQITRETLSFSPSFEFRLTERLGASVGYAYLDREYDRASGLNASEDNRFQLATNYALNPKVAILTTLSARAFETNIGQKIDGYAFQIGMRHKYSEVGQITYNIGYDDAEFESGANRSSDSIIGGRIAWQVRGERSTVTSLISRSQNPSASGGFVITDMVGLTGRFRVSEKLEAGLQARYFQNESQIQGLVFSDDRDYLTFAPSLSYLLTEKWKINLRYKYTRQDRDIDPTSYDQNEVAIGISYTPLREF